MNSFYQRGVSKNMVKSRRRRDGIIYPIPDRGDRNSSTTKPVPKSNSSLGPGGSTFPKVQLSAEDKAALKVLLIKMLSADAPAYRRLGLAHHKKYRSPSPSKIYTANHERTSLTRREMMEIYDRRHAKAKADYESYRAAQRAEMEKENREFLNRIVSQNGDARTWSRSMIKLIARVKRKRYEEYGYHIHVAREEYRKAETEIARQIIAEHPRR